MSTDLELGMKIHELLTTKNLEHPYLEGIVTQQINEEQTLNLLQKSFTDIVTNLGLDLKDPSMADTPKRLAKMYYFELCGSLGYHRFPKITKLPNTGQFDEIILIKQIEVKSLCEHHFVPISGYAHVAYIPKDWVLGLSKFNRVVDFFSRRPQIQERLTEQVAATLSYILETDDVAVIIDAEHFCVKFRGVEDPCSSTVTSKMGGRFMKDATRAELLSLINLKKGL